MANKRRFAYRDPSEDEYVFHCLANYPQWAKEQLTASELQILKTEGSMRKFINNATGDQKRLMLAKANIRFIALYVDMNVEQPLDLQNFNKLYRSMATASQRKQIIDDIMKGNTFAISSRETLNGAYLIAQNCHTPYWYTNQNYRRVYDAVKDTSLRNLKNFGKVSESQEVKDLWDFRDICVNFFLACQHAETFVRVSQKSDMIEVMILMHLFIHRDMFIEKRVLQKFLFKYKPKTVSTKLFQMVRAGLIDVNRSNKENSSYTIAEMGIIQVNEIMLKTTQSAVVI